MEREGGISPRVSPMAGEWVGIVDCDSGQHVECYASTILDVRDFGNLLSRAGFTMTTVDVNEITVDYPTPFQLMADLRSMGENNAVLIR